MNTEIFNEEQVKNLQHIFSDKKTFIRNCIYGGRYVDLNKQQELIFDFRNKNNQTLVCGARDCGKTFETVLENVYHLFALKDIDIAIVSISQKHTKRILYRIKRVIKQTPFLKPYLKDFEIDTKTEIVGPSGVVINAYPGTLESVLGEHPQKIYLDEAQQFKGELMKEIFYEGIYPTQSGASTIHNNPEIHLMGVWGYSGDGFVSELYNNIKDGKEKVFKLLDLPWYDCDCYKKEDIEYKQKFMGKSTFLTQFGGGGFLPGSGRRIDPNAIERSLVDTIKFNPKEPCYMGIDPAFSIDEAAIVIIQKDTSNLKDKEYDDAEYFVPRYSFIEVITERKKEYDKLAKQISYLKEAYGVEKMVVDSTSEIAFLHTLRNIHGLNIEGVNFSGGRKQRIFDAVKLVIEGKDALGHPRASIPRSMDKFIHDIHVADPDPKKHLPDTVAAAGVILNDLELNQTPVLKSNSPGGVSYRKSLKESLGLT